MKVGNSYNNLDQINNNSAFTSKTFKVVDKKVDFISILLFHEFFILQEKENKQTLTPLKNASSKELKKVEEGRLAVAKVEQNSDGGITVKTSKTSHSVDLYEGLSEFFFDLGGESVSFNAKIDALSDEELQKINVALRVQIAFLNAQKDLNPKKKDEIDKKLKPLEMSYRHLGLAQAVRQDSKEKIKKFTGLIQQTSLYKNLTKLSENKLFEEKKHEKKIEEEVIKATNLHQRVIQKQILKDDINFSELKKETQVISQKKPSLSSHRWTNPSSFTPLKS